MKRFIIGIPLFTTLWWLGGAYIETDWLWFLHIIRPEDRGSMLVIYTVACIGFVTCPLLWPWE